MAKFFLFPFGVSGDRTAIPDVTQISGSVSYEQGFGLDYQKDLATDPQAKPIPRDQTNELYYQITDGIRQYQSHGVPDFITTADNGGVPFAYDIYAVVRYDAGSGFKVYENSVAANITLPTDPSWRVISGGNIPIGVMLDFGGSIVPSGYLPCDGSQISQATYPDLYLVLGTIWGPDGGGLFTLPDFRRRVAIGSGGTSTLIVGNTVGSVGGTETHTLTIPEMPAHTHTATAPSATSSSSNTPGNSVVESAIPGGPNPNLIVVSSTGSGVAHNIIQPSSVVTKIIKY